MSLSVWRVRPLAVPVWLVACARCDGSFLESTGRFRVNSNGGRHDVWLIYRCPHCSLRRKLPVHRRVTEDTRGVVLAAYRRNDPELAESLAFAVASHQTLPYRVERPPLPATGRVQALIVQPLFCGVRWDRFVAHELGWSRSRVRTAWRSGVIRTEPRCAANTWVRDGQRLHLDVSR
jgi:hypothetical protein